MHKNNLIDVALIDDGINEGFYNIGQLKYNIEITPQLEIIERQKTDENLESHGTICAAIIKKYSSKSRLSSIKVLNSDKKGLCEQFVKAIEWCTVAGINVINLSLGSVHYKDRLKMFEIVNEAVCKGIVIVAACSNMRVITYPSYFSNVIGVKADIMGELKEGEFLYNYYPNDGIDITAYSKHLIHGCDMHESYTEICNSYATPFITAKVSNILLETPALKANEIKQRLVQGAINKADTNLKPYLYKNIDWIGNAVIFRLVNSKSHNISEHVKSFNLVDCIDVKCDCYCNGLKEIRNHLYNNSKLNKADTIIVDTNNLIPQEMTCSSQQLFEGILNLGKKVVYLDDKQITTDLKLPSIDASFKLWHPSVFNYLDIPSLGEIDMPMLAVYDFTGSVLVDFLCELQNRFREDDYNIITASDTCSGIIAGIEYSPLHNKWINQEIDPGGLRTLCGMYRPDILVYGITSFNKDMDYLKEVNNLFEIDVSIIISDNYNSTISEFTANITNSKLIALMPLNESNSCFNMENFKIFDLSDINYVDRIYSYIISIYNQ